MSFNTRVRALPACPWLAATAVFCLAIYLLRLDPVAGAFIDDGWYILLGKALATGHGLTLINSPSPGIMPFYPPAFPAVLSLIFRLSPRFPENVYLLKLVSIAAVMLSGALSFIYFVTVKKTQPQIAAGLSAATVLTPAIVFLATSTVMSECFFFFVQMATIVSVELSVRRAGRTRAGWLLLVGGAGCAAIAFLTRSVGIGLIPAVLVYLLLNKRFWQAICFSSLVLLLTGPWLVYTRQHRPSAAEVFEQKGYITQSYEQQLWQTSAGAEESGAISLARMPQRIRTNLLEIIERDMGGILLPALYRTSAESGAETLGMTGEMGMATDAIIISCILSALCMLGLILHLRRGIGLAELALFMTLPVVLAWPWPPFRFLLPFTPFLLCYAVEGVKALVSAGRHAHSGQPSRLLRSNLDSSAPARLFLMFLVGFSIYDHAGYLLGKLRVVDGEPPWIVSFRESESLMRWMNTNVDRHAVIATENPPLVNLYTGLKTISEVSPVYKADELRRRGADQFVHISLYFDPGPVMGDPRYHVASQTEMCRFFVLPLDTAPPN